MVQIKEPKRILQPLTRVLHLSLNDPLRIATRIRIPYPLPITYRARGLVFGPMEGREGGLRHLDLQADRVLANSARLGHRPSRLPLCCSVKSSSVSGKEEVALRNSTFLERFLGLAWVEDWVGRVTEFPSPFLPL
ncbi:hypothetical protein CEXT_330911 [Caerostris extrusa]|uniref:Uncharacterized protein n=1 Tax=Caerostris extrusa TaxID=172846 RepID=A0AAV4YDW3_CAEEX|nr:hypothetical protein CEXT_330911 [Caerostris extrusa]